MLRTFSWSNHLDDRSVNGVEISAIIHASVVGLGTGLALIVAIGAQNAFVLRQGLLGRHVAAVVAVCAASDAALIAAGILGMGGLVTAAPAVVVALRYIGAAFLFCYGMMAARRAFRPQSLLPREDGGDGLLDDGSAEGGRLPWGKGSAEPGAAESRSAASGATASGSAVRGSGRAGASTAATITRSKGAGATGLAPALATILALTWLNPHVYLDTVLLVGSIAAHHGPTGKWWFGAGAGLGSILWFTGLGYGARLAAPLLSRPRAWQVLDVLIGLTMLAIAFQLARG